MLEEWFIIVNPHAGSGKTISAWNTAEKMLKEAGVSYICSLTDCRYHAIGLAASAAAAGYRKFVAVGGDGTVHEVLGGILNFVTDPAHGKVALEEFTLGVIPIGSGNDWIRSHKIRNKVTYAVGLLIGGHTVKQDVAKVSIIDASARKKNTVSRFTYMVNVGGVGLDARVCRRVNRIKERGKGGKLVYVKALLSELLHYRHPGFEIVCDGRPVWKGKVYSIAFGLGRYSGGGLRQTPAAVLDDGLIDLTVISPMPLYSALVKAVLLLTGQIGRSKDVMMRKCTRIVVRPLDNSVNEPVEVDGEILGQAPMMLEVLPEQINVLSALTDSKGSR